MLRNRHLKRFEGEKVGRSALLRSVAVSITHACTVRPPAMKVLGGKYSAPKSPLNLTQLWPGQVCYD